MDVNEEMYAFQLFELQGTQRQIGNKSYLRVLKFVTFVLRQRACTAIADYIFKVFLIGQKTLE